LTGIVLAGFLKLAGDGIQDSGFGIQDSRCRVQDSRCRVQDARWAMGNPGAG
jgi:hypothetical protein